jgi:pimeloyl-ACP methyl ester carboxylesterase
MRARQLFLCALSLLAALAPLQSQAVDTTRARAAFAAVTALRNDLERSHGRFVSVNGIRMHYLEWGDRNGVPLVWAHSNASSAYEIRAVAPRLAQAGYRVLAVDYRGHGLTRVTDYDFTIHHIADDLVGLLDSLKIPAAVFGGSAKGAFVAASVYDHYPSRVLGLLMGDGGTWSRQWIVDRETPEEARRRMTDPIPQVTGASEFDVFRQVVGNMPAGDLPMDWLFDMLMRIGPVNNGWAFLPAFDRMVASNEDLSTAMTRPTRLPPLQWSEQALIPRAVFRRLHVPMMILDPQDDRDVVPAADQNERLVKDHPHLVIHRVYAQTRDNVVRARPDWVVRDAVELLDKVRQRRPARSQ